MSKIVPAYGASWEAFSIQRWLNRDNSILTWRVKSSGAGAQGDVAGGDGVMSAIAILRQFKNLLAVRQRVARTHQHIGCDILH